MIDDFNIANTSDMSARVALNVDFMSQCISNINSHLDSLINNSELNDEKINYLKKEIGDVMIKQLINDDDRTTFNRLDPELKNNNNYLSFLKSYTQLSQKYPELYVAFVDGKFFKANSDLMSLHIDIDKNHPNKQVFIKKIATAENIISLSRPRRIIKD